MGCVLLGDDDVRRLPAAAAVDAMQEAVLATARGQLAAPPRVRADLGDSGGYVFTVGGLTAGVSGFRVYRSRTGAGAGRGGDQLVAIWDAAGTLIAVIAGTELGARRTGALGGLSARALARPAAATAAVIGSGIQAWTQLWALAAVRQITSARVFSPDRAHREQFAARAARELGFSTQAAESPRQALDGADVIILATRSPEPVIAAEDVEPGAHVITVGPKLAGEHETPLELVGRAALISCDSPAQAGSYGAEFFTGATPLVDLGAILAGEHPGRTRPEDITLHCSVGLAGTEVVLGREVLRHAAG